MNGDEGEIRRPLRDLSYDEIHALCSELGFLIRAKPRNPMCDQWAQNGECLKNFVFMLTECKEECAAFTSEDTESMCAAWAKRGHCNKNRDFMSKKCALSCRVKDEL